MKNILIILTDEQRKDSLGCYGNPICRTPNLDSLGANGIRFERNYVDVPICMPNRLSLLTGKNARSHGLWTNGLILPEQETVASHFQQNGYQTASIGKIHFTPHGAQEDNMESGHFWQTKGLDSDWNGPYWGFETVELAIGHTEPLAHYGKWFYKNGGTEEMMVLHPVSGAWATGTRHMPEELHPSSFVGERTCDFLKNRRDPDKPFFLVASFPDPHHPFDPPDKTAKKYSPDDVVMPVGSVRDLASRPQHYMQHFRGEWTRRGIVPAPHPEGASEAHTRERIAYTYAMVDLIDQNVGKILDALKAEGLEKDTVVVFTSDHGELLGDHGLWFKGPFYYEGLLNTPLIISSPGQVQGRLSKALFSDIDLASTLCDLAGIPDVPFANGISQAPHLMNPDVSVRNRCLIEYRNGYGDKDCSSKAIVTDQYKYIRYQTGEEELTDLAKNPEESENRAGHPEYREIKSDLQMQLLDEILATEARGPKQVTQA